MINRILVMLSLLCFTDISFGWMQAELEMFKDDLPTIAEMEYIKANTKIPGFRQELDTMIKAARAGYEFQYWFDLDVNIDEPAAGVSVELFSPDGHTFKFDREDTYEFNLERGYFTVDQTKADFPPGQYTIRVFRRDGSVESTGFVLQPYTDSDYPDFVEGALLEQDGYLNLLFSSVPDVSHYEIEAVTIKDDMDLWEEEYFYLNYPEETTIDFDNQIETGLYDCDIDVSAKRAFGGGEVDVWLISCKNWFSFTQDLPVYDDEIIQCVVTAGKNNKDSISFSGQLAIVEEELIFTNKICITLSADSMANPKVFTFPVNQLTSKNGKYSCTVIDSENVYSQFKYDSKTHRFTFSSKNVDLTGLACLITVAVEIGNYSAQIEMDESIVNGTRKTCPLSLLQGVSNSLDVTKSRFTKGRMTGTDLLAASGTFTVGSDYNKAPLAITVGDQTFTVSIDKMGDKNNVASCVAKETEGITAKLDYDKCTFTISIKNADITQSGTVPFGINCFGVDLDGLATVNIH